MVQSGTWIPGRSEAYIQKIGNTDLVITTAGALHDEERKLWKDYEKGVEDDLLQVAVILNTIDQQVGILKGLLAEAQQRNVKVAAESALGTITLAIGQIPEKWKVGDHTGFGKLKDAITNYLRLNPWEKGQTDIEIASFGEQIIEQAKAELGAKKPSKKLKKLQNRPGRVAGVQGDADVLLARFLAQAGQFPGLHVAGVVFNGDLDAGVQRLTARGAANFDGVGHARLDAAGGCAVVAHAQDAAEDVGLQRL